MCITVHKKGNIFKASYRDEHRTISSEGENKQEVIEDLNKLLQELGIDRSKELEKCKKTERSFSLSVGKSKG